MSALGVPDPARELRYVSDAVALVRRFLVAQGAEDVALVIFDVLRAVLR